MNDTVEVLLPSEILNKAGQKQYKHPPGFKKGSKVRIVTQGKGETQSHRIMTHDGSALHHMEFDSHDAAHSHATKAGYRVAGSKSKT